MTASLRSKAGRIALVTGAARGLGLAYARRLAEEGATVIAVDQALTPDLKQDLTDRGASAAEAHQLDVSDADQVDLLCRTILDVHGRCEIVVNNAGISPRTPFLEATPELWRRTMAVNVESAFLICRGLAPAMMEARYGRIVNVGSDTVGLVITGFVPYIASKAAVVGFTRGLANDLGPYGVTVNCIAPGLTRTPNTEREFPDGAAFDQFAEAQAIKRPAIPEDLAGAMSFLTSDDAAFITGQCIIVDGGLLKTL